jgi:nicotinate-nucleotide adenylyltransferase
VGDQTSQPDRRILLFGGTFDPPHLAHAKLPAQAATQLGCDEILYIPAAINPLKLAAGQPLPTAKEHRLAMLLIAIADVPDSRISTLEIDRPRDQPSYTIDTLRQLHALYVRDQARDDNPQFQLLIGCDQAIDFHRWKDWHEILALAVPAVMLRPPWTLASFESQLRKQYSDVEAEQWLGWTLHLPMMDISATRVRQLLQQGQFDQLAGLLDPAVIDYIRANNLYRSANRM